MTLFMLFSIFMMLVTLALWIKELESTSDGWNTLDIGQKLCLVSYCIVYPIGLLVWLYFKITE